MLQFEPLPRVIIFYGPPGSGKNTQAELLLTTFTNYTIVDYGSELRSFVQVQRDNKDEMGVIARRVEQQITTGALISVEDLMEIISTKLIDLLNQGKSIFLIGPGRMLDETTWLAKYLKRNEIPSCVLHLHLSLEDIIERLSHRYFVPGSNVPYSSYEEAKLIAGDKIEPIRRDDDLNADRIVNRYRSQYKNKFSSILFTFQLEARSHVFLIDASQPIAKVTDDILQILDRYYIVPKIQN